jgi:hypothetical protein
VSIMIDVLSDELSDVADHTSTVIVLNQTSVLRTRCHNPKVTILHVLLTQRQLATAYISTMPLLRRLSRSSTCSVLVACVESLSTSK